MTRSFRLLGSAIIALGAAAPLRAQDSQFGIKGLGTPGRMESVRARSTAGAFAAFDPTSALVDAALGDQGRLAAWTLTATSFRRVSLAGADASLTTTRFPQFGLSGPVGHGITVGGGIATYLDRSYDLATHDTVVVRGVPQPVTDHLVSDGAVADIHVNGSASLGTRFVVGFGMHLLTGSTRVTAKRTFDDSTVYANAVETDQIAYDGMGVSASVIGRLGRSLRLSAFARSDSRLRARLGGPEVGRNDLPLTLGGGMAWELGGANRVAATVVYQSWGGAGQYAHNTVNWAAGAELGNKIPLRFGVRGGHMPFSPVGPAPREWGVAVGAGLWLRQGRGLIDFGLERLARSGAGLSERVWTAMLGITVRP
jgi:hypothetical protein